MFCPTGGITRRMFENGMIRYPLFNFNNVGINNILGKRFQVLKANMAKVKK